MSPEKEILQKRDQKAIAHLEQYAPVWLIEQKVIPEEDAVQFNVVFQHHLYGWVNRRYRYDAFNDVLYHKGQTLVDEERLLEIQESTPWIQAIAANIPNAYGG
jgi:hypothetical protein